MGLTHVLLGRLAGRRSSGT